MYPTRILRFLPIFCYVPFLVFVMSVLFGTWANATTVTTEPEKTLPTTIAEFSTVFANPPRELHSRPLWFWNTPEITSEKIEEITRHSAEESGYAGFGILPSFGPTNNFSAKDVYLTEEYFSYYRAAIDAAKKYNVKLCLYDEYWFPSGAAGGVLRERFPDAVMQELVCEEETLEIADNDDPKSRISFLTEGVSSESGTLMARVAIHTVDGTRIALSRPSIESRPSTNANSESVNRNSDSSPNSESSQSIESPQSAELNAVSGEAVLSSGTWRILTFHCRPSSQPLVDYLDGDAVKRFIELTHDAYYSRFAEHFGTTIDSVFYDEPPLYRVNTWTPRFNEKFREKYGASNDPTLLYPDLFFELDETTPRARVLMFGLRSELFATEYIGQMDQWCREHRVQLTGHMDQEQIQNPTATCGDLLYCFRHQEIPGIDEIGYFGRTQNAYKIISSAAVNWDRTRVMSETYGAITGMPVHDLYRIAMDEYAKGINLLVPHAIWFSDDPQRVTFEPELSWRNVKYGPELPAFNRYVGRLNLLLQRGSPVADIAILYPIATLNAGYQFGEGDAYQGGAVVPEADYQTVGENLSLHNRHDFTYLHPEALRERCVIDDNLLCLTNPQNPQSYQTLILPGMKIIDRESLRKVKAFYDAGGRVIVTTQLPSLAVEPDGDAEVQNLMAGIFGDAYTSATQEETEQIVNLLFSSEAEKMAAQPSGVYLMTTNAAGGVAVFVPSPTPEALDTALKSRRNAQAKALTPVVYDVEFLDQPTVIGGNLTYLHKTLPEMEVYFFANSSETEVQTTVALRNPKRFATGMRLERWNPHNGEQSPLETEPISMDAASTNPSTSAHSTQFTLQLSPFTSVFVIGHE